MGFASIFSHPVACLLILLIACFIEQKSLILMKCNLSFFLWALLLVSSL